MKRRIRMMLLALAFLLVLGLLPLNALAGPDPLYVDQLGKNGEVISKNISWYQAKLGPMCLRANTIDKAYLSYVFEIYNYKTDTFMGSITAGGTTTTFTPDPANLPAGTYYFQGWFEFLDDGSTLKVFTQSEPVTISYDGVDVSVGKWSVGNGKWYYSVNGAYVKGWRKIDGTWYFFDKSTSAMRTGWVQDGGVWYYMDLASGGMRTGWVQDGGAWYYMRTDTGAMKTGWVNWGGNWYYMDLISGAMKTGWAYSGGAWYYMEGSGTMHTGWLHLGNTWYFMISTGEMLTGTQLIDGRYEVFDNNGAWVRTL